MLDGRSGFAVEAPVLERQDFRIFRPGYERQTRDGFQPRGDKPPLKIDPPIDWDMDPFSDRNWCFQLHSWRMLEPIWQEFYEANWDRLQREVVPWVVDWYRFHIAQGHSSRFAWYDMAAGMRAQHLALLVYLHRKGAMPLSQRDWAIVRTLARVHIKKLRDKQFIKRNNHGMFQLVGLRLLGTAMHGDKVCKGELEYSTRLMRVMLDDQFDAYGVHRENSPHYHELLLNQVARIRPALYPALSDEIARITRQASDVLPWFTLPDGKIAAIGDSEGRGQPLPREAKPDAVLSSDAGDDIWVRDLSRSGYAIVRSAPGTPEVRASMLIVKGQAFSHTHAHADQLGIVLFAKGRQILVDPGKYGYGSDRWREYFVSDRAHNVVGIQGHLFGPADVSLVGAGLEPVDTCSCVRIAGIARRGGRLLHRRSIEWHPARRLEVVDQVDAGPEDAPVVYWHLAPDLGVERTVQGIDVFDNGQCVATFRTDDPCVKIRLVRGREEPLIQGWFSPSYGRKVPATVAEFRAPAGTKLIRTRIDLVDGSAPDARRLPRPLTHDVRFDFDFRFKRDAIHVLPDGRTQRRVLVSVSRQQLDRIDRSIEMQLMNRGFSKRSLAAGGGAKRRTYTHPDGTTVVTRTHAGRQGLQPSFYFAWSRLPSSKRKGVKAGGKPAADKQSIAARSSSAEPGTS